MTRYELVERIGHGGMAEIFRGKAVAAGGFEKPVAIKRILPHLSQDNRFVKLLIDEANLLSGLRHRNIVQIFDVGLGDDGQYFIVMEFVDGTDLGALYAQLEKKRKRLPVDLALHIVGEVCDALDYAHRARTNDGEPMGLVHRDVSPPNIVLSVSGEVKLTDFGIAKKAEEQTGHGGVRGKFAYISPEQAANKHVDARSDVYSLGVVLYELLLGHRLFSGMSDLDALSAVRSGRIPKPSEIDRDIDDELEDILLKAMARDPMRRFESAAEMGKRVREFRYSMPSTGSDPAKELSRVINRLRTGSSSPARGKSSSRHDSDHEPTVVRIQTAAGFTTTGFEIDSGSLTGADIEFDFDDDETTSSRSRGNIASLLRTPTGDDELNRAETRLLDTGRRRSQADTEQVSELRTPTVPKANLPGMNAHAARAAPEPAPPASPGVRSTVERAATPTIRDVFFNRDVMAEPGPAATNVPHDRLVPRKSRRRLIVLVIAAAAVAITSFLIATQLLGDDDGMITVPDAGVVIDAAPPKPDKAVDKPKPKPKVKKRKRPRKRTKKRRSKKKTSR